MAQNVKPVAAESIDKTFSDSIGVLLNQYYRHFYNKS
jgi:hypothetical protein